MNTTQTGTPDMQSDNKKPPKYITIADVVPFTQLNRGITKHKAFENIYGKQHTMPVDHPNDLVGIEIEVEGLQAPPYLDYYWNHKTDGSLRNYGAEYASIPLRAEQVETALWYLKKSVIESHSRNLPSFSPRTSTHVHVNVRDLSWEHIYNFVLLYAIFERHFFLQTNKERERGIFCVPLYRTDMLRKLKPIEDCSGHWYKYAAINLCTIIGSGDMKAFGTIEFRHMHGTWDAETLVPWINNILTLKKAAKQFVPGEIEELLKSMNTTSTYLGLYTKIFGMYARTKDMQKADFEYCITMVKLALFSNPRTYGQRESSFYKKYNALLMAHSTRSPHARASIIPNIPANVYNNNINVVDEVADQDFIIPTPMPAAIKKAKKAAVGHTTNGIHPPNVNITEWLWTNTYTTPNNQPGETI